MQTFTPQEVYESFRQSMLANDADWEDMLAEDVSLSGPLAQVQGKEKFILINLPFFASIKESLLHEMLVKDEYVITRITTTVTLPNNELIDLEVCEWYEIKDGLVQSLQVFFDTAEFRAKMGM